ncbi:MAG: hypothetical protein Tsb009_10530 [Planctomycetaceae bacterium]
MANPVFREKFSRRSRSVRSWLDCLLRGKQRRQQRRTASTTTAAITVEHLEERTLLTMAPFSPESVITTMADGARDAFAADIDGDGDLDVVSASENDGKIAWWENVNGDASVFNMHEVSTAADGARSVFAADMDGDGDLDILSASSVDDKIAWYENVNGDGLMWDETAVTTMADDARSVFAADVNGDGNIDVISASYADDTIAWYSNDMGDGSTFTEVIVSTGADGANSVFAEDVDRDGDIDIVSASQLDHTIRWFENTMGDGLTFNTIDVSTTVMGASSISVGDIDGDGDFDIVSSSSADDTIFWHEHEQFGAMPIMFTDRVVDTNADGANGVFIADVDNDGDNDIFSASPLDNRVVLYENDGDIFDPVFTSRDLSMTADGAYSVIAADIDGDGDTDVLSASGTDDKLALYRNETIHRGAVFQPPEALRNAANGAYSVAVGDIDGDGDMDVVTGSVYDGQVRWYENDGDPQSPAFTERLVGTTAGVRSIQLASFNNDGTLDIIVASAVNNTVGWFSNDAGDGSSWTLFPATTSAIAARTAVAGDIDGDGDMDLISASSGDDTIRWFESSGGLLPVLVERVITNTADGARDVTVGDVDGDGDLDVIVASYYDDRIAWYENGNGDGTVWARRLVSVSADGARSIAVADVDGDGDLDILSASTYDHTIAWYENDGASNPTFTPRLISNGEQGAQFVSTADLDLDGDLDIISVAEFPDAVDVSRIAYFMNDGADDPTFTRNAIDTTNDRPVSVATGDLDGDGDLDVVSASILSDDILAYRNGGGQLGLATEDTSPTQFIAGVSDDVLKITATHNGRMGDSDLEIATFELRFERTPGVPLTTTEVNSLIFDLDIFLDDGDGIFNELNDTLLTTIDPLGLDLDGDLTVAFNDGDPNVQIAFGTPRVYFVAVETAVNAFLLNPKTFRITHVTEASSTAEDASVDFAASVDFVTNVSTPVIDIAQPNVPLPGVPSITGPIGISTDTTPTISWTAPVGAERYDLMIFDIESGQMVVDAKGIVGTNFNVVTPLEVGKVYEVFVQAINVGNEKGEVSTPEYFSIDPMVVPPAIPTLTGPTSSVFDTTPIITWTASAGATSYDLLVYNVRLGQLVLNPQGIAGTSFTPGAPLPPDNYQIFVRANNAGGSSQFSAPLLFDTKIPVGLPAAPILTGPAKSIPDSTPTITWTAFAGAVNYDLLVYSITKGQEILNVAGIGATEFTTPALAEPDTYQVFVRATLPGNVKTVFSRPLVFDITSAAPIPNVTEIVTPSRDTRDATPTFIWNRLPRAATYDVIIFNINTGQQVFFATGIVNRFVIPGAALTPGSYQAHVRGVNSAGEAGQWSKPFDFKIIVQSENSIEESLEDLQHSDDEELPQIPQNQPIQLVAVENTNGEELAAATTAKPLTPVAVAEKTGHESGITEPLDSVMTAWPETEWWMEDESHMLVDGGTSSDSMPESAWIGGVALGFALPFIRPRQSTDGSASAGTKRRKRRKNSSQS